MASRQFGEKEVRRQMKRQMTLMRAKTKLSKLTYLYQARVRRLYCEKYVNVAVISTVRED